MQRSNSGFLPTAFSVGMIPAAIAPLLATPLAVLSIAYIFVGIPVFLVASKRRRRRTFIAKVRATGVLPAPKDDHDPREDALVVYQRKAAERRREVIGVTGDEAIEERAPIEPCVAAIPDEKPDAP